MRAFVAVVEERSLSAAARRLHVSQPALSQTMAGLEREFGVPLLTRSSTGALPTEAGRTLLTQARAVLQRYEQALAAMAAHTATDDQALRIGIPLELPAGLLSAALADLKVQALHMSTVAQAAALRSGRLDLGLLRERPTGDDLDAVLVLRENLGVLLAAPLAAGLKGPDGIPLEALAGLDWIGFPRSGSPAWYDLLTATLRGHGIDPGPEAPAGQELIPAVKLAAVGSGGAFALAPPDWPEPLPPSVSWSPLAGNPLVRRTWAVWPAHSHRRDLGRLVVALRSGYAVQVEGSQ